jgi:hypothetical protein
MTPEPHHAHQPLRTLESILHAAGDRLAPCLHHPPLAPTASHRLHTIQVASSLPYACRPRPR